MDITALESAYRAGTLTPTALVEQIYGEIEAQGERPVWITVVPKNNNLALPRNLRRPHRAERCRCSAFPSL